MPQRAAHRQQAQHELQRHMVEDHIAIHVLRGLTVSPSITKPNAPFRVLLIYAWLPFTGIHPHGTALVGLTRFKSHHLRRPMRPDSIRKL